MKSATLGTILSVVSLAGVGVLYVKVDSMDEQIRPLTQGRVGARHHASAGDEEYRRDPPATAPRDEGGLSPAPQDRKSAGEPGSAATPEKRSDRERIRELEKELSELKANRMPHFGGPRFARSVKELSSTLKLSKTQETRIEAAVDRGRKRIEDLLKIPDESGVSPYERQQETRKKLEEAMKTGKWQDVTAAVMGNRNYRGEKIPGRNATYGEEIDRVKQETRDEIASNLDAEQKKAFDDTRIDPLLGESSSVAVSYVGGSPDGPGSIFVEGDDITVVGEEDKAAEDDGDG